MAFTSSSWQCFHDWWIYQQVTTKPIWYMHILCDFLSYNLPPFQTPFTVNAIGGKCCVVTLKSLPVLYDSADYIFLVVWDQWAHSLSFITYISAVLICQGCVNCVLSWSDLPRVFVNCVPSLIWSASGCELCSIANLICQGKWTVFYHWSHLQGGCVNCVLSLIWSARGCELCSIADLICQRVWNVFYRWSDLPEDVNCVPSLIWYTRGVNCVLSLIWFLRVCELCSIADLICKGMWTVFYPIADLICQRVWNVFYRWYDLLGDVNCVLSYRWSDLPEGVKCVLSLILSARGCELCSIADLNSQPGGVNCVLSLIWSARGCELCSIADLICQGVWTVFYRCSDLPGVWTVLYLPLKLMNIFIKTESGIELSCVISLLPKDPTFRSSLTIPCGVWFIVWHARRWLVHYLSLFHVDSEIIVVTASCIFLSFESSLQCHQHKASEASLSVRSILH